MQCRVIEKLFQTMETIVSVEKLPQDYGTGHLLYHSELCFLEMIYRNPDCNAIALAEMMNVTRGAVTQMSNKLQSKGFIERFSKLDNKKEKYYRLTETGAKIRMARQKFYSHSNVQICQYLRTLNEAEQEVIMQFLDRVADVMPIDTFDCVYHQNEYSLD